MGAEHGNGQSGAAFNMERVIDNWYGIDGLDEATHRNNAAILNARSNKGEEPQTEVDQQAPNSSESDQQQ